MTLSLTACGVLGLGSCVACCALAAAPQTTPAAHIDHVILGAADLDAAVEAFQKATGVRPVYGGRHPRGTHNALVSLGDRVYLEILAPQPAAAPAPEMAEFARLDRLTPMGWAVSAPDVAALQRTLQAAGFPSTQPAAGSRSTPDGLILRWQTLELASKVDEAPFFISWDPAVKHPSATSPAGCVLRQFTVAGAHAAEMRRLRDALGLAVEVQPATAASFTVTLSCPSGSVVFGPPPAGPAPSR